MHHIELKLKYVFSADKAQEALIMLLYYMATILIGAACMVQ